MAAVPVYISILFAIAFASVMVQGDMQENTTQPEIEVVAAPHHVVVEKNASLLLNCSVTTSSTFGPVQYHWRKDGVPLPVDEECNGMQTFPNGSLYISRFVHPKCEKERLSVEGLYECVARNNNGRVLARRVRVEIAGSRTSELTMTDQQIGIIVGVSIGIICIITCVVILVVCHRRCFYSRDCTSSISRTVPAHYTNGHVITSNGNDPAHTPLPSDMTVVGKMTVPETAPMLSRLPENELSDAK